MQPPTAPATTTVWTVGHSNRTFEDFLAILAAHGITAIADVRRFPGSRRYPWFASESLAKALPQHDLAYEWIPQLGGRRRVQPDSPNGGWRNASFQGYADHLASAEFDDGLQRALALAARRPTALMCAEALWWQCHRALISDVLTYRGIAVIHILDAAKTALHTYTAPARVDRGRLEYPPAQGSLL